MSGIRIVERATDGGGIQRLAVSDVGSIYGCCGAFDMCGDADLMSLSFAGNEPLLSRPTVRTATEAIQEKSDTMSDLQQWVMTLEQAFTRAFRFAGQWLNLPETALDEIDCHVSVDYDMLSRAAATK